MIRLNCFALASLYLAIVIPHLLAWNYSRFSFEVGFFAIVCVLLGVGIGYVARNRFVFGAILGFGIYFLLDTYFVERAYAYYVFLLCIFGVPLLLKYTAKGIPLAVFIFSVFFILPDFLKAPAPLVIEQDARVTAPATVDPPDVAYIHLILDEQMSPLVEPDAMPSDFTSDDFFNPYLRNGFKVYGLTNSNSKSTVPSLSAIFGLTTAIDNYTLQEVGADFTNVVNDDRLVQNLIDLGFSTTVIESSHLRLCGDDQPLHCRTYSRVSNLHAIEKLDLPLKHRVEIALISLHEHYYFGAKTVYVYQRAAIALNALRSRPFPQSYANFARPPLNTSMLRDMEKQMTDLQPGEAIIAHLLIPHFPYALDPECGFRGPSDWGYPVRRDNYEGAARAYRTFWDQAICTGNLVGQVLDHVADRDDVVVFVHGDHGGRILYDTPGQNEDDTLGTFLAVKSPNATAGLITSPVDLQETFNREFTSAIGSLSPEN
jgi:hypothetical protein